jgi:hypothetical protein
MEAAVSFRGILFVSSVLMASAATGAHADVLHFKADLKSEEEVPPVQSRGSGTVTATYDTHTHTFAWKGSYAGLTGPVTAAHFHGPAAPGANAGVMLWISENFGQCHEGGCTSVPNASGPALASPFEGSSRLTDRDAGPLKDGRFYVNIHTDAHPAGELRGQVLLQK